jgi:anti-sigma regulatory factor (Ser/Thr protein kinase)
MVLSSESTWPARPEHVRDARQEITELALAAGLSDTAVADVRLAVSEAVGNAIRHGYRDGADGTVTLKTETDTGELRVCVTDDGCGIAPDLARRGAGLGLPLIAGLSESLAVQRRRDRSGTIVRMVFRTPVGAVA